MSRSGHWEKIPHNISNVLFFPEDGLHEPHIYILDSQYRVGCEFYGAQPTIGLTPLTDKCFLSMSQAISIFKGALLSGPTGVGKTETVKVTSPIIPIM